MVQAQKYLPALALVGQLALLVVCSMAQAEHLQATQRQATLTIGITRGQMRPTFIGVLDDKNNFKNKEVN